MCGKVALVEHWPLRQLVLRTPRLELRPDDDAGLDELAAVATAGVHPPEEMPFGEPWTDADRRRPAVAACCSTTGRSGPRWPRQRWNVHFLVRLDGRVIGTQKLGAGDFAITREVRTGSWIGLRHQGQGIGTEMRAAVVLFAFDHLGATAGALRGVRGQPASLGVSRRLGYRRGRHRDGRPPRPWPPRTSGCVVTPPTLRPSRRGRWGWTGYTEECPPLLGGISPG